ncbi:hypothetical protein BDZ91DRAFT_799278 [Kalaharituber pfeilii]|nr:hypothetical protein BDZ91DRAFT_799278 [Kalaharituber pfeilii]
MNKEPGSSDDTGARRRSHHPSPFLRLTLLLLRVLILLCSLFILCLFIWWYVRRSKSSTTLAVLILAAISSGWALFSLVLTVIGHSKVVSVMALVDLVHVGALIAISILLRDQPGRSCGPGGTSRRDCQLLKSAFGFAVGLAVLYAIVALLSLFLVRAFRKSRPFGPSPENDYQPSYNPAPKKRGYITPALGTATGTSPTSATNDNRNSTYTTSSTGDHRAADADTSGLLGSNAGTAYARPVHHSAYGPGATPYPSADTTRPVDGALTTPDEPRRTHAGMTQHTYESYRAPTPVGGRTRALGNSGGVLDMPSGREYGGSGYEGRTTGTF